MNRVMERILRVQNARRLVFGSVAVITYVKVTVIVRDCKALLGAVLYLTVLINALMKINAIRVRNQNADGSGERAGKETNLSLKVKTRYVLLIGFEKIAGEVICWLIGFLTNADVFVWWWLVCALPNHLSIDEGTICVCVECTSALFSLCWRTNARQRRIRVQLSHYPARWSD